MRRGAAERVLATAFAACFLAVALPAAAAAKGDGPHPPCGTQPVPNYPSAGEPPRIALWSSDDLGGNWVPPACTGFDKSGFLELVALAGRFGDVHHLDEILSRAAAVSTLKGVQYWSITDQRWQVLVTRAAAIENRESRRERPDFTAADLRSGRDLNFVQEENRVSEEVVFRLHLDEIGPGHAVLTVENVSPVTRFFIRVMEPGDLRSIYYLDRADDGTWMFYSLLRVGHGGSILDWLIRPGSYLNRAVALYRHFAGIPTDQEPPGARR
jgi:hypothetical protein